MFISQNISKSSSQLRWTNFELLCANHYVSQSGVRTSQCNQEDRHIKECNKADATTIKIKCRGSSVEGIIDLFKQLSFMWAIFKSLYWIWYNIASGLCFGFLASRHEILALRPGIEPLIGWMNLNLHLPSTTHGQIQQKASTSNSCAETSCLALSPLLTPQSRPKLTSCVLSVLPSGLPALAIAHPSYSTPFHLVFSWRPKWPFK